MDIIIDLDGTICEEKPTFERCLAQPIPGAVEAVNDLYYRGHHITIYTARSWSEQKMTADWLKRHGVHHHQLIMGKPVGQVWIDDRAMQFTNWKEISEKLEEKINKKK